jgi:hypothetical protein
MWSYYLGLFVTMLSSSCPNLEHLSLMNNEAAPSFFNGGTFVQYQDYRLSHHINECSSSLFMRLFIGITSSASFLRWLRWTTALFEMMSDAKPRESTPPFCLSEDAKLELLRNK